MLRRAAAIGKQCRYVQVATTGTGTCSHYRVPPPGARAAERDRGDSLARRPSPSARPVLSSGRQALLRNVDVAATEWPTRV